MVHEQVRRIKIRGNYDLATITGNISATLAGNISATTRKWIRLKLHRQQERKRLYSLKSSKRRSQQKYFTKMTK